jgi:hypothetical protein
MSVLQIAGIITGVAAALVIVWKVRSWAANIVEGLRSLLRNQMMNTYYKHKDEGALRQYEMENFQKTYEAYKALNGNSFIDQIADQVKDWDVNT